MSQNRFIQPLSWMIISFILLFEASSVQALNIYSLVDEQCNINSGLIINVDQLTVKMMNLEGQYVEVNRDTLNAILVYTTLQNPISKIEFNQGNTSLLKRIYLENTDAPAFTGWPIRFVEALVEFYDLNGESHLVEMDSIFKMESFTQNGIESKLLPNYQEAHFGIQDTLSNCQQKSDSEEPIYPVRIMADKINISEFLSNLEESEIADWASMWSVMPWEIISAMEEAVIDGKVAFSRSGATSKNVNWLSLIVPNDAKIIQEYLSEFKQSGHIPMSLKSFGDDPLYFDSRYDASINWINENNHAVISNGPFLLDSYSPEARTIIITAFADQSYPITAGAWSKFEDVQFPRIVNVDMPSIVVKDETLLIPVMTEDSTRLQYFFTNSEGLTIATGIEEVDENPTILNLPKETTDQLLVGANDLKIFAISDSVLRPDIFRTSFLVVENKGQELPSTTISEPKNTSVQSNNYYIIIIGGVIILGIILYVKNKYSKRVKV